MTVAALPASIEYVENGVTLAFAVPFRFNAATDIKASRVSVSGVITTLIYGTEYSVTGGASDAGGTLTVVAAAASGTKLRIKRSTPRAQDTQYPAGDRFPAETHEATLDRGMLIHQELDDVVGSLANRALLVPDGDAETGAMNLPNLESRAGRVMVFDGQGRPAPGALAASLASVAAGLQPLALPAMTAVETVGALTALAKAGLSDGVPAFCKGYHAALDFGGGVFRWVAGSTATDDGGMVLAANEGGSGRWQRVSNGRPSVAWWGATGNGTTDDTPALQAAINHVQATANGELFIPPNVASAYYRTTAPLIITKPVSIIGAGEQAVTILAVGLMAGQAVIDFDCLAADVVENCHLSGLTVRSNNGAPNGIHAKNISYTRIDRVRAYSVSNAILFTGTRCFSNTLINFAGYNIGASTLKFAAFSGGGQFAFVDCTFSGVNGVDIQTDSATDTLAFINPNFEGCTLRSFLVTGTVLGLTLTGSRTEACLGDDFVIYPAAGKEVSGLSITGSLFSANSAASVPITLGGNGGLVHGFSITGNHSANSAINHFVLLNGGGDSGVISGNRFAQAATLPVSVPRPGVVVFSNENANGLCPEHWGAASWGVTEGTFTPTIRGATIAGDATPDGATGRYTRTGDTVEVWIMVDNALATFTAAPTGSVLIGNLPFPAATLSVGVCLGNRVAIAGKQIVASIAAGASQITLADITGASGVDSPDVLCSALATNSDLYIHMTYRA